MTSNIHVSFDLDGTLIDSIPLMKESWENVNNKLNLKVGWDQYKVNIGLHFDEICNNLKLEYDKEKIRETYFEYNKNNIDKIKLMPGVKSLLADLHDNNISWSIITSKPRCTTTNIIKHFKFQPEIVICSDDINRGKPNHASADLLHEKLGNQNFETIYYVGDTVVDHLFAINSGFKFIQFRHEPENLTSAEKSLILRNDQLILNSRAIISTMDDLIPNIT